MEGVAAKQLQKLAEEDPDRRLVATLALMKRSRSSSSGSANRGPPPLPLSPWIRLGVLSCDTPTPSAICCSNPSTPASASSMNAPVAAKVPQPPEEEVDQSIDEESSGPWARKKRYRLLSELYAVTKRIDDFADLAVDTARCAAGGRRKRKRRSKTKVEYRPRSI